MSFVLLGTSNTQVDESSSLYDKLEECDIDEDEDSINKEETWEDCVEDLTDNASYCFNY